MMTRFEDIVRRNQPVFHRVVPFDPKTDKVASIDLTSNNKGLDEEIFNDTDAFTKYIDDKRKENKAKFLIGGYNELRALYGRSELFAAEANGKNEAEPRRLHLGVDIWGERHTPVFAPLAGTIHSFAFNHHYGDYGVTIVLLHHLEDLHFYTLYGHLSLRDIEHVNPGKHVRLGEKIAHLGEPHENGHWPPHLHFQIIIDMESKEGDYPGVCKYSEREKYLNNCPDPDLILQMNRFVLHQASNK
jgi:murein DD-endopeptidase MepM/ murein hydrolase activator NlpD